MKERALNVLKWFFITLGVLFLAQIILFAGIMIYANTFKTIKVPKVKSQKINNAQMQTIIDYVEKYKQEKGVYPENINDINLKNDTEYKYEVSDNSFCYKIELTKKNSNSKAVYQKCSVSKEGIVSQSENYTETNTK